MTSPAPATDSTAWRWAWVESLLILLLFFLAAGWPAPEVNEAHYLAKAKHYWDPAWCRGDPFLESADAHRIFYWSFGWLTLVAPLPVVAWWGRFLTWGLLAWSWRRLSWAVAPQRFVAVLSAGLFLMFSQRFHMAGEWVVGGVEAKGFAYVFVLLALEALLRQRWRTAWLWLGAATSFHVLVGGWSMVAAGCAWLACGRLRPSWRVMVPGVLGGLLLAAPGLIPALALAHGVSPEIQRDANLIYVYGRLPHHLVFHVFPHEYMVRQAALLVIWVAAGAATPCLLAWGRLGQRPLRGFVGGAVAIALVGIVIDQSLLNQPETAAALLKYYWFRLSDAMLPVGAALALVAWLGQLQVSRPALGRGALAGLVVLAGVSLAGTNLQHRRDLRPGADRQTLPMWESDPARTRAHCEDWQRVCAWIAAHTPAEARFLTPRHQQTFKWYAQRSEVCAWKDVPQDAAAVVDWWQRLQAVYPRAVVQGGLAAHSDRRLLELAQEYQAEYLVVDRYLGPRPLTLPQIYPRGRQESNGSYAVYRVPGASGQGAGESGTTGTGGLTPAVRLAPGEDGRPR